MDVALLCQVSRLLPKSARARRATWHLQCFTVIENGCSGSAPDLTRPGANTSFHLRKGRTRRMQRKIDGQAMEKGSCPAAAASRGACGLGHVHLPRVGLAGSGRSSQRSKRRSRRGFLEGMTGCWSCSCVFERTCSAVKLNPNGDGSNRKTFRVRESVLVPLQGDSIRCLWNRSFGLASASYCFSCCAPVQRF